MSQPVARAGAGLRLMRTAVFTAVCVVLAAAGHTFASGAGVTGWTAAAGFLVVFAAVAALAGRERSLPAIAGALTAGQIALHALFTAGGPHTAGPARTGDDPLIRFAAGLVCGAGPDRIGPAEAHRIVSTAGIDPASLAQGGHAPLASGAADPSVMAVAAGLLPGLPMFLAHLLAALATGWLLRRGEVAVFRLVSLSAYGGRQLAAGARLRALRAAMALVRALRAGLPDRSATGPLRPRTAADAPAPPAEDPLQHLVIRRGPPPVCVLAA
ncbi:hypothetical protein [Streptomyces nitrosporeus]|uniref:hypothetical protein n=1 Tax=Streptomyces nitrosporeus TaxID=28894 RepID=UPI003329AE22